MHTSYELKKFKTDIITLCEMIMDSLDKIEYGIKTANCRTLNTKVRIFENLILYTLSNFENFLLLLTENEDFEEVHRNLTYTKSLLSTLRCCINSDKKDFYNLGINLICDLVYDECEKAINNIQKIT